jgi:hypothetical protein
VRIPIPADDLAGAPATLPQWYFDPTDGRWYEEGVFTRNGNAYEGTINHFSIWNCDVSGNRCFITGRVIDGSGAPVECARVEIWSVRQSGGRVSSGESCTGADGRFRIPVEADSTMTYQASKGQVQTAVLGPESTCQYYQERDIGDIVLGEALGAATISLVWGPDPRDLDSHLAVPLSAGGWEHVFFPDAGSLVEGVRLDTDDTNGYGPEIFTIFAPLRQGTYRYSVHHFSGNSNISLSGASVTLIVEGVGLWTFTPPAGGQTYGDVWRVFDLIRNGDQIRVDEIGDFLYGVSAGDDASFTP